MSPIVVVPKINGYLKKTYTGHAFFESPKPICSTVEQCVKPVAQVNVPERSEPDDFQLADEPFEKIPSFTKALSRSPSGFFPTVESKPDHSGFCLSPSEEELNSMYTF